MDPLRNLLIAAINKLLSENLIQLSGESTSNRDDDGYITTEIFGEKTVINWSNIGHQELRVSVWWKFNPDRHPQINLTGNQKENFMHETPLAMRQKFPAFVGVCASGWLERKDGKHLQGKGRDAIFSTYVRRGELHHLQAMPVQKPNGFNAEGRFYL